MVHLSSKSKQAIVQKVLSRDNSSSMEQIAKTHNIKGITYEDCANETVIETICNFYTFLLDNHLFN